MLHTKYNNTIEVSIKLNIFILMMSTSGHLQQLQQELQNELNTSNQLLRLISIEVQKIKNFTTQGGKLETNIKENTLLMATIANIQHIDLKNLPQLRRAEPDVSQQTTQNMSYEQHDSFRCMDESQ